MLTWREKKSILEHWSRARATFGFPRTKRRRPLLLLPPLLLDLWPVKIEIEKRNERKQNGHSRRLRQKHLRIARRPWAAYDHNFFFHLAWPTQKEKSQLLLFSMDHPSLPSEKEAHVLRRPKTQNRSLLRFFSRSTAVTSTMFSWRSLSSQWKMHRQGETQDLKSRWSSSWNFTHEFSFSMEILNKLGLPAEGGVHLISLRAKKHQQELYRCCYY